MTDPVTPSTLSAENIHAAAHNGGVAVGAVQVAGDLSGNLVIGINEALLLHPAAPAPPANFTGRDTDLAELKKLISSSDGGARIALQAMGGFGKTALALKLAQQVSANFPGGVLWCELGQQPNVISRLSAWILQIYPQADLSKYPDSSSLAALAASLIARLGKVLVIIDDVWDSESAAPLMSALPAGCPLLITTRSVEVAKDLDCEVMAVGPLSATDALQLLKNSLHRLDGHEAAAQEIVKFTEGLPLALKLVVGQADSPADLPSLVKRLRTQPILDVLKRGSTRDKSIEVCFTMSYERLDDDMQRRFRALGVFAPAPFDREAIAAVWDEDGDGVDDAIKFLLRRSLLSRVIANQAKNLAQPDETLRSAQGDTFEEFHQHALLREFAVKLLHEVRPHPRAGAQPPPSMKDASTGEAAASLPSPVADGGRAGDGGSRHAAYYRAFAEEQNWRTVEHFFDQIDYGWQWVQVNAPDKIVDYEFATDNFLRIRGREPERISWMRIALQAARDLNDRKNEGVLLNNLGYAHNALGQKDQALDFYQQALAIWREVGDRSGEGTTLNNLGLVYDDLGQKDKALDFYQQALAIRREVGDRSGEGTTLNNLGLV